MKYLAQADIKPTIIPWDSNPAVAIGKLISGLIGLLLILATIWAFVQLLIGGFNWISSSGDKGKLEEARGKIMQAIVGLFIVFTAWIVFMLIMNFLGVGSTSGGGINLPLPKLF